MRSLRRRTLTAVSVAAASALILAGCSSGTDEPNNATNDDATPGTEVASDVEQTFTIMPAYFPVSLDIAKYPAEEGVQLAVKQTLETLVTFDGEMATPLLATEWQYIDDTTLTFTLRDNVTFSDGTPFTANDVKASLERYMEAGGPFAVLFAQITELRVDDDLTFTIVTSEPVGTLVGTMSLIFIGKADSVNDDAYWMHPIGTGPFTVNEFVADDRLILDRNETYWGEPATLDRIEMLNIPEVSARITALETGEIDAIGNVPPDQVSTVEGISNVSLDRVDSLAYYFLWFNHEREPFNDVKVRQALRHALNIEQTVSDLYGDNATVARAPIPQAAFGATQQEQSSYDPDLAKELLAEAGYPDGFSASMQWPAAGGPSIQELARSFISDWEKVGVRIEPLEKERALWVQDFESLNWDMNLQVNSTPTGDADYTLNRLYTCSANRLGYCNPELDEILTKARASLDQNERQALYAEANEILWEQDAAGAWPLEIRSNIAYRDGVTGLVLPPNGLMDFSQVSITQ